MANAAAFLAYSFKAAARPEEIKTRIKHAEDFISPLYRASISQTAVGDALTGFVGWSAADVKTEWRSFVRQGDAAIGWLHIPSIAGGPETGVDEWNLAHSVLDGSISPTDIGPPFAAVRWNSQGLEIINDVLGLVRLFHFQFEEGDVWTTRPGLAHVFMGIPPKKNHTAWASMGTLGWATSGSTQLGNGTQMPGGVHVRTGNRNSKRFLEQYDHFPEWFLSSRRNEELEVSSSIKDLEAYVALARRWPEKPTADLTGGKDSRVVAAIGLRTNAIAGVRTVMTDYGEVESAKHLVAISGLNISHDIIQRKEPSVPGESFIDRLNSQHRAWEGRYLATTAFNSASFRSFSHPKVPRLNGLGGEVLAGGNLLTTWHDRLINAPARAAHDRLVAMVRSGIGTSKTAQERTISDIERYVEKSLELDVDNAAGVMDLFYARDRMPNWSVTYCTPNSVTPLFAPTLLAAGVKNFGKPLPRGALHKELLEQIMPQWADVPFYTPSVQKRATPFAWQKTDWNDVRSFIEERADAVHSFDIECISEILMSIDVGEAGLREERLIQRFVWELTFDTYLSDVSQAAAETATEVARIRRTIDGFI